MVSSIRGLEALERKLLEAIFDVIPAERGAILEIIASPDAARVARVHPGGFAERARRKLGITDPAGLADFDLAGHIHADDFQLITPAGRALSKEQYLGAIAAGSHTRYLTSPAAMAVRVRGQMALVRYQARIELLRQPNARQIPGDFFILHMLLDAGLDEFDQLVDRHSLLSEAETGKNAHYNPGSCKRAPHTNIVASEKEKVSRGPVEKRL